MKDIAYYQECIRRMRLEFKSASTQAFRDDAIRAIEYAQKKISQFKMIPIIEIN